MLGSLVRVQKALIEPGCSLQFALIGFSVQVPPETEAGKAGYCTVLWGSSVSGLQSFVWALGLDGLVVPIRV